MTKTISALAAAAFALVAFASSAEACLSVQPRQTGVMIYDPTSPYPHRERILVTIRASEGCGRTTEDGIGLIDIGFTRRLGDGLALEVTDGGVNILSADHRFDRRRSYDLTGRRQATLEYDVIVPRGQKIDGRGVRLDLVYAQADPSCRDAACRLVAREERTPLDFDIKLKSVATIALSGGGASGAVDFQTLQTNESRQVALEAVATTPFRVSFESQNAGVLLLQGGERSRAEETVPYGLRLDGRAVGEGRPFRGMAVTGTGGDPLKMMLEVTILDARAKRAGKYKDVLTITIEPSLSGPAG